MYYVNREQIDQRLEFIPVIIESMEELQQQWEQGSLLHHFAQERVLQLAIETVTDVGSYMIDGLLMREASSYEDIIEILRDENVFSARTAEILIELVKLRKPLVQQYYALTRNELHPMIPVLPEILRAFAVKVTKYIDKELGI